MQFGSPNTRTRSSFSNNKAIKLYESFGFTKVRQLDDIGFIVMQKYVER